MSSNPTGDVEPARLWNLAVVEYNVGKKSEHQIKANHSKADDLAKERDSALKSFKVQRHDGGLVDRIRTSLGAACQAAQVAVQPIGNLLGNIYPPASAISQALTLALGGCGGVTDKLDQIETFYQTIQFFFERLALLEKRMPQQHAFQAPLTRVFVAILNIIKHTEDYVRKGRFIAFGKGIFGRDGGLADSYTEFNHRINDLECSVIVATLGTVTESSRDLKELSGVTHMIYGRLSDLVDMQRTAMTRPPEIRGYSEHTMRASAQRWSNSGTDSASRNFRVLESGLLCSYASTERDGTSYVPGTCVWVDGNEHLSALLKFDPQNIVRTVCITGESGTGRSMLAFYIFGLLKHRLQDDISRSYVVYFSFSDDHGNTWSFQDMIKFCAIQIAKEDESFRRKLMELSVNAKGRDGTSLEKAVFKERRLYLVLDGIDHCEKFPKNLQTIYEKLRTVSKAYPQSRFVLVTQKADLFKESSFIKRTEAEFRQDLRLFSKARLQTFPNLQRRREARQDKIVDIICSKADRASPHPFLYVLDALRRFSDSENLQLVDDNVLKDTENVQKAVFSACITKLKRRNQQLQCVWTWLAWSKEILKAEGGADLDIEKELNSSLSQIFSLTADVRRDYRHTDQVLEDEDNDESSLLGFSAASLRTFYRDKYAKPMPDNDLNYDSRVLMFKMVGSILTMEDEETSARYELISYASSFWLEHPESLGAETLYNDTEISIVVCTIIQLLDNNQALRRVQNAVQNAIDADQASKPSIFGISSLKNVNSFLQKAGEKKLKWRETQESEDPQQSLMKHIPNFHAYLASRHVNIWWTCNTPREAYTSFRLTHQILALKATKKEAAEEENQQALPWKRIKETDFDGFEESNLERIREQIILVSEAFDESRNRDGKSDPKADRERKRGNAMRLLGRSMAFRFDHHYQEAINDVREGLDLIHVDDGTKVDPDEQRCLRDVEFEIHNRMGRIYFGWAEKKENSEDANKDFENALGAFKKAIKVYEATHVKKPMDDKKPTYDKERGEKLNMIDQLKALMEANMCEIEADLKMKEFQSSTKRIGDTIGPKRRTLIYFDDMILALATRKKWNLIAGDLLEAVPEKQLATDCSAETHELLQLAANQSKKCGGLMEKYKEAIRVSENVTATLPLNSIRVSWAACIRRSGEDEQKHPDVQKHLEAALKPRVWGDIEAVNGASWQLAHMLLEEFRLASTGDADEVLNVKEMTWGKMKKLLQKVQGQVPNFQAELSFISIPLAIMDRDLGPTAAFKTRTDAMFLACFKASTDDDIANDKPSLQVLAKLLSLLGLDKDARVAASCQFYTLDGSPPDQDRQVKNANRGSSTRKSRNDPKGEPRVAQLRVPCSTCGKSLDQNYLATKRAFLCLYCTKTVLRNSCHSALHSQNASDWSLCKPHHIHIEAPADDWDRKVQRMFPGPGIEPGEKTFQVWLAGLNEKREGVWKNETWKTNWLYKNIKSSYRRCNR
ncbi:hypothetical protein BKA56DRAFT_619555 [Ilyonectria sp. MPI-CAGE-AT-0026]|nr:hypothetical protein BKA56DRAFT_619555 [Ilyonectria sp. MPI-CAGE-AT-0026]